MYTKSNQKKIRTFLCKHVNLLHPSNCNSPKSVLTAHFPRKKYYRETWKSAKNVQGTHPHYIANPKGSEVNWELLGRTKEFSLSGFPDTIMLKHWLEQQRLKTALQRAGLVPYLRIFTQFFGEESTNWAMPPFSGCTERHLSGHWIATCYSQPYNPGILINQTQI